MNSDLTYIVLVNYNGWKDTIECISSIRRNGHHNYKIIVVENGSTDDSMKNISEWASGHLSVKFNIPSEIENLVSDSTTEINFKVIQGDHVTLDYEKNTSGVYDEELLIIESKTNLGFAGGNNLGARLALMNKATQFVWFLNNDTVIDHSALTELIAKARELNQKTDTGLIQSKVLFYNQPDVIQAVGGKFNVKTAWSYHLGIREQDQGQYDKDEIAFDYVFGASLFATRKFLEIVGLMNEQYYLYFEELDWHERGIQNGFKEGYAYKSKIYHKQGAATGKKIKDKNRPAWIMGLKYRNLLIYYRKYHRKYIFAAYLRLFSKSLRNISQGNWKEVKVIIQTIAGKSNWTPR